MPTRIPPPKPEPEDYTGCLFILVGGVLFWIAVGVSITFLWPW